MRNTPTRLPVAVRARIKQLLNSNSAPWFHRGETVFAQDPEDDPGAHTVEQPIARFRSDDAAELTVLLRTWFWALYNEVVTLTKKLADVRKQYAELVAKLEVSDRDD